MTRRDRRSILMGAAVVLCAVLVTRVMPAGIRAVIALREHVPERLETVARARDAVAAVPALRDSMGRAAAALIALAPRLIEDGLAAEAQANLSSVVSLAASRSDLRVTQLNPVPDSVVGVFGRVAVHVELEGDLCGVTRFVYGVEVGDPLLTISTLGIAAPTPVAASNQPEMLRVEARVEGLYLRRER